MTVQIVNCQFCGKDHGRRCPEVRAIEYFENGTIKRVEFMTPVDYHTPMTLRGIPVQVDPALGPKEWKIAPFGTSRTWGASSELHQGVLINAGHG